MPCLATLKYIECSSATKEIHSTIKGMTAPSNQNSQISPEEAITLREICPFFLANHIVQRKNP